MAAPRVLYIDQHPQGHHLFAQRVENFFADGFIQFDHSCGCSRRCRYPTPLPIAQRFIKPRPEIYDAVSVVLARGGSDLIVCSVIDGNFSGIPSSPEGGETSLVEVLLHLKYVLTETLGHPMPAVILETSSFEAERDVLKKLGDILPVVEIECPKDAPKAYWSLMRQHIEMAFVQYGRILRIIEHDSASTTTLYEIPVMERISVRVETRDGRHVTPVRQLSPWSRESVILQVLFHTETLEASSAARFLKDLGRTMGGRGTVHPVATHDRLFMTDSHDAIECFHTLRDSLGMCIFFVDHSKVWLDASVIWNAS